MHERNLPQSFEGFSTAELLRMWDEIPTLKHEPQDPPGKVAAMRRLLREHRLAPVEWRRDKDQRRADVLQARKLLKPYGIEPAPWADAEGNSRPPDNQNAST